MVPVIAVAAVAAVIGGTCWWIWKARHSIAARKPLAAYLMGDQVTGREPGGGREGGDRCGGSGQSASDDYGSLQSGSADHGGDADD